MSFEESIKRYQDNSSRVVDIKVECIDGTLWYSKYQLGEHSEVIANICKDPNFTEWKVDYFMKEVATVFHHLDRNIDFLNYNGIIPPHPSIVDFRKFEDIQNIIFRCHKFADQYMIKKITDYIGINLLRFSSINHYHYLKRCNFDMTESILNILKNMENQENPIFAHIGHVNNKYIRNFHNFIRKIRVENEILKLEPINTRSSQILTNYTNLHNIVNNVNYNINKICNEIENYIDNCTLTGPTIKVDEKYNDRGINEKNIIKSKDNWNK